MEGGSTEHIAAQVEKCPSGALTYFRNEDSNKTAAQQPESEA